jgi:hypothetical protein
MFVSGFAAKKVDLLTREHKREKSRYEKNNSSLPIQGCNLHDILLDDDCRLQQLS